MVAAVRHGIEEIVAECGGACSCGTCHCYVDSQWLEKTSAKSDMESALLACLVAPKEESRLSCQIIVTPDLDGLVVHLPESQY